MVSNDLRAKAIAGLKIHTDNWNTSIETFMERCADCPYYGKSRDGGSNGCVYNLLKDALTALEGDTDE